MSAKQRCRDILALGLARGLSIAKAAKEAALSERTAHRILAEPGFREQVAKMRGDLVERALGTLSAGNQEAAVTLRKLLRDKSPSIQLAAARAILDSAVKIREAHELAERVAAIEAGLRQRVGGDREST